MAIIIKDNKSLEHLTADTLPTGNVINGTKARDTQLNTWQVYNGSAWVPLDITGGVISVNNKKGEVIITGDDINIKKEDKIFRKVSNVSITEKVNSKQPINPDRQTIESFRGKHTRTYFCWIENTDLAVWVKYYDHETKIFSDSVNWGKPRAGASDVHATPAIYITADGYIVVIQEQLSGTSTNNHNSPHHFRKSNNPEDISSYTDIVGSPFGSDISYPHMVRLKGKDVFFARTNNKYDITSFYSDNNCSSFKKYDGNPLPPNANGDEVFTLLPKHSWWAYHNAITIEGGAMINIYPQTNDGSFSYSYPTSFVIFTADGETFGNWVWWISKGSRGWSKDVKSLGALTYTEMFNNNFVVIGPGIAEGSISGFTGMPIVYKDKLYVSYLKGTRASVSPYTVTIEGMKLLSIDSLGNKTENDIIANNRDLVLSQELSAPSVQIWGDIIYIMFNSGNEAVVHQSNDFGLSWFHSETLVNISKPGWWAQQTATYINDQLGIYAKGIYDQTTSKLHYFFYEDKILSELDLGRTISLSGNWQYDATVRTIGAPTTQKWAVNNANPNSATFLTISHITSDGGDAKNILNLLADGGRVLIQDRYDSDKFNLYTVSGTITKGSGFTSMTVVNTENGSAAFVANASCVILVNTSSAAGGGGGDIMRTVKATTNAGVTSTLLNSETLEIKAGTNMEVAEVGGIVTLSSTASGGGTAPTGLEKIEGASGKFGWRLIGFDPSDFDTIGENAIDLSVPFVSGPSGALGKESMAIGPGAKANGAVSIAIGLLSETTGDGGVAIGTSSKCTNASVAIGGGNSKHTNSIAIGSGAVANYEHSIAIGSGTTSIRTAQSVIGTWNKATSVDSVFELGIGTGTSAKKNGLEIFNDGTAVAPEMTTSMIDNFSTLHATDDTANPNLAKRVLITKEYADINYGSSGGAVTSVTASSPLESTEGTTPVISHKDDDGTKHVPATGTGHNGHVLTAGNAAGVFSWQPAASGGDPDQTLAEVCTESGTNPADAGTGIKATDFVLSSDISLKYNIKPLKSVRLNPVSFGWKANGKSDIGFIAQEIEVDFPEIVVEDGEGLKTISYSKITAINAARINELEDENRELRERLDRLEVLMNNIL